MILNEELEKIYSLIENKNVVVDESGGTRVNNEKKDGYNMFHFLGCSIVTLFLQNNIYSSKV